VVVHVAPAMHAIVFTDICDSVAHTYEFGDAAHIAQLHEHNQIVRSRLAAFRGREVKHTGDGIMAAFASASYSIGFAASVQRAIWERNQRADRALHVRIGISAGEPVSNEGDFFGASVQLAARLCELTGPGEISVSVGVRELCIGKPFRFEARGPVTLHGHPEPTPTYGVAWRE
jgi:adenylate cyclase